MMLLASRRGLQVAARIQVQGDQLDGEHERMHGRHVPYSAPIRDTDMLYWREVHHEEEVWS